MSANSQELIPAGHHTLVIEEPDTTRAIMLMDSHDLEQAMAELRGEVLATFVYRPPKAKPQLTYAGVKEAARLYRNVHFGATAMPLPDGTWLITSYAHNLADNTRVDYPMPYPAFNPANPEEAIKFRANLSKSLRNALSAVIPVAYLQTMIERWLEQGNEGRPPTRAPEAAAALRSTATVVSEPARPAQAQEEAGGQTERGASALSAGQLLTHIKDWTGLELATGKDIQELARKYGQPAPASGKQMTQAWALALYQAIRANGYERMIESAQTSRDVEEAIGQALGARDGRHITAEQYYALRARADARQAELSAPVFAGSAHSEQVAS